MSWENIICYLGSLAPFIKVLFGICAGILVTGILFIAPYFCPIQKDVEAPKQTIPKDASPVQSNSGVSNPVQNNFIIGRDLKIDIGKEIESRIESMARDIESLKTKNDRSHIPKTKASQSLSTPVTTSVVTIDIAERLKAIKREIPESLLTEEAKRHELNAQTAELNKLAIELSIKYRPLVEQILQMITDAIEQANLHSVFPSKILVEPVSLPGSVMMTCDDQSNQKSIQVDLDKILKIYFPSEGHWWFQTRFGRVPCPSSQGGPTTTDKEITYPSINVMRFNGYEDVNNRTNRSADDLLEISILPNAGVTIYMKKKYDFADPPTPPKEPGDQMQYLKELLVYFIKHEVVEYTKRQSGR